MATLNVNWIFTAQVNGGPQFSASQPSFGVAGFDHGTHILAATNGTADVTIDITHAKVLLILADTYSTQLSYKIDASATVHNLDGPHVFIGPGAVAIFGTAATLHFSNTSANPATVQVFIGS